MAALLTDERVRFSMFDWLDESGRDQGETYAERLRMLELADTSGFYCYHLAEHHATELSTVPSPNLFLAAAAQRTQRLRLGPLSYVIPLYEPVRLLEEICMLDQLSGGRLELGLSRGSTGEHIDNDPEKARGVFNEALGCANRATFVLDKEGVVSSTFSSPDLGTPRAKAEYEAALAQVG